MSSADINDKIEKKFGAVKISKIPNNSDIFLSEKHCWNSMADFRTYNRLYTRG